ncbi:hypothetical protein AVEN_43126-1 [Araneus ventricosus]|uniref:Uncharacterized protein n=1 Tax=Araneus ventricosus TaxID=182803 RepID=A0A4Y2JTX2_ARAVE|nr:hypothetical protein AVEN_43126-1 [Araneus ventricosus]
MKNLNNDLNNLRTKLSREKKPPIFKTYIIDGKGLVWVKGDWPSFESRDFLDEGFPRYRRRWTDNLQTANPSVGGTPGHRKCGQHNLAPNNMHQEERKFIHLLAMLADIESEVIQDCYSGNLQLSTFLAAEMAKGAGSISTSRFV